jgi:hypothetical protein
MGARRRSCRFALVVVGAVFVTAGCLRVDGSRPDRVRTPEELGQALLTATDLGSGWTQVERTVGSSAKPTVTTKPGEATAELCPQAAAQEVILASVENDPGARVVFVSARATDTTPLGVIEQLWSGANAKSVFASMKTALATCAGTSWTAKDGETLTVTPLAGPSTGTESLSYVETAAEPGGSGVVWKDPAIFARFGYTIVLLQQFDVQAAGAPPRISDTEWNTILKQAALNVSAMP